MTVTLLYVSHNRLEFVRATFEALIEHTNWKHVRKLIVCDDNSTDGTSQYIAGAAEVAPCRREVLVSEFGGPVAALNAALDRTETEYIAKIDNDLVVCPDWLDVLLETAETHPRFDAIGMEPGFAGTVQDCDQPRTVRSARWIGGQGLFRTRCFAKVRPSQNDRFFGLTSHWRRHATTGWIDPDLPVFNLDHLACEPWASLARRYVELGWSRRWEPYSQEMMNAYAGWWLSPRETTQRAAVT